MGLTTIEFGKLDSENMYKNNISSSSQLQKYEMDEADIDLKLSNHPKNSKNETFTQEKFND
jgi:hypothetical protein